MGSEGSGMAFTALFLFFVAGGGVEAKSVNELPKIPRPVVFETVPF